MAHNASVPLLEVRGLRCERDERLLFEDVDFTLHAGEVMQVAGPNGCGKTTMLRTIAGLSQRCTGTVAWRGRELGRDRYDFLRESLYLGHEAAVNLANSVTCTGPTPASPCLTPQDVLYSGAMIETSNPGSEK